MTGGSERKTILVGLILALVLGVAVYLRLWTIDYTLSSDDTERLRFSSSSLFSNRAKVLGFCDQEGSSVSLKFHTLCFQLPLN